MPKPSTNLHIDLSSRTSLAHTGQQRNSLVPRIFSKLSLAALILLLLSVQAYAEHGYAVVSDIDHVGAGTFSGAYTHASGSTADHPWFVLNLGTGDKVTINISTTFESYGFVYQAPDGSVDVGDYQPNGTLTNVTEGGGNTSHSLSFTASSSGQYALQLDSYIGGSGNYTVTISVTPGTPPAPSPCNTLPTVTLVFNNSATVMGTGTPTITVPNTPGQQFQVFGGSSFEFLTVLDRINGYEIRQKDENNSGIFTVKQLGPFSITVRDGNGCSRTVQGILASR